MNKLTVHQIQAIFADANEIILTTHINPDGDGLGAEAALFYHFEGVGTAVRIFNADPLPELYSFLFPDGVIETPSEAIDDIMASGRAVILVLDTGHSNRLGGFLPYAEKYSDAVYVIDHHPEPNLPAAGVLVEPEAASTGEIVYSVLADLYSDGMLPKKVAEAIYTTLVFDTGSFRFQNTRRNTYEIAAQLVKSGIEPSEIYSKLFESSTIARLRALGFVLDKFKTACDDRVVYFTLDQRDFAFLGIERSELDGFMDILRTVKKVEVALMFYSTEDGGTKVGLRSKKYVSVREIAQRFGGGGHFHAAGILSDLPLDEVVGKVLAETKKMLVEECMVL
jgi:phosphoesterase RecJ-like protein